MPHPETHDLEWLAKQAAKCDKIVELGSLYGASARAILDNSDARLWCIDSWRGSDTTPKRGFVSTESHFQTFLTNVAEVRDRIVVLKMFTREAVGLLPEKSFDMVFIDADHAYDAVRFDITNFAPLVKPGGILCGHDYGPRPMRNGLIRAVNEIVVNPRKAGDIIWWTRREPGWLERLDDAYEERHIYVTL